MLIFPIWHPCVKKKKKTLLCMSFYFKYVTSRRNSSPSTVDSAFFFSTRPRTHISHRNLLTIRHDYCTHKPLSFTGTDVVSYLSIHNQKMDGQKKKRRIIPPFFFYCIYSISQLGDTFPYRRANITDRLFIKTRVCQPSIVNNLIRSFKLFGDQLISLK